ncbi:maltase A2-like [Antedon mediterranea]|uniref:maltase A2-like n=1 Tax=Antedon mediterranea TaxID=105859 RepID=UPI003AF44542
MSTPDRDNYEMAPQAERDVEKAKQVEEEEAGWTGLGKDELLAVADTPAWNWTRNVLLVLFWVTWVAMLIAAIWIVVTVPRCPDVEWWEKNVVYQVEPRSFYDTGDDGVGDLKGIKEKLGYLEELNVKNLYINSIFAQANGTNTYPGNHIVDFKAVDENLGTLDDFTVLVEAAGESSIKVILEFIPNHSSDQHPWFMDSKANATGPKADYYIWSDNGGSETIGDSGAPAWTNVPGRGYYYHSMDPSLPDLNYNNEDLRKEITDAMNYWLELGVDGMVITNVDSVVDSVGENSRRRRQAAVTNDTVTGETMAPTMASSEAATTAMMPEPEATKSTNMDGADTNMNGAETGAPEPEPTYVVLEDDKIVQDRIAQWREVFTDNSYLGKYRLLLTSGADSIESAVTQYGNEDRLLADIPLNIQFLESISGTPSGDDISASIDAWEEAKENIDEKTASRWNSWMLSNNNVNRLAKRCSSGLVNVMNTLLLTLPGTPIVMYGEELGMQGNADNDNFNQLAPMSWASSKNANFSKATPWKALDSKWMENNVEELKKDDMSTLNIFKSLVNIHLESPVVAGTFDLISSSNNGMAYLRRLRDWPTYLVVLNFGSSNEEFEFPSDRVRDEVEAVLSTDGKFTGKDLNVQTMTLAGQQAAIFKFKAIQ